MTLYDPDLITIFLAELEVNHPQEFAEFKASSEIHALYFLRTQLKNTKAKTKRRDLISELKARRKALYHRLAREGRFEMLLSAELLLGPAD